jgi:hypothetical protein
LHVDETIYLAGPSSKAIRSDPVDAKAKLWPCDRVIRDRIKVADGASSLLNQS